MEDGSPTGHLDNMYTTLLQYAWSKSGTVQKYFKQVVDSIVILADPMDSESVSNLLRIKKWEVEETLEHLHAVIDWSIGDSRIHILHTSFQDFLLDPRRCDDHRLSIQSVNLHSHCFRCCINIMSDTLKEDICDLRLSGTLKSEIHRRKIDDCIPPEIQYACRY